VDVAAAPVLSYADEVFSGKRKYLLPTPIIPGCGAIGRVRAFAGSLSLTFDMPLWPRIYEAETAFEFCFSS